MRAMAKRIPRSVETAMSHGGMVTSDAAAMEEGKGDGDGDSADSDVVTRTFGYRVLMYAETLAMNVGEEDARLRRVISRALAPGKVML